MPDIILTVVSGEPVDINLAIPGVQGPAGQPAVASGGTTGQLLVKASSTDYQTAWSSSPSGLAISNSTLLSPVISGVVSASSGVTILTSGDSGGFFGASPVVCPSGIAIPSGGSSTEEILASLSGVIIALRNLGLIRA